jgi:phage terminase small subunit
MGVDVFESSEVQALSFQGPDRTGFKGHPRKKALFVAALIEGKNLTQARKEVGISVSTCWKWSQEPEVRDKVEKGISDAALYAGVSRAWVISKLKEVAERCMQAQPVNDKLGRETGLYVFDSSGANRSLELIGKHLRVFGDDASSTAQLGAAVMSLLAKEAQTLRKKKLPEPAITAEIVEDKHDATGSGGAGDAGTVGGPGANAEIIGEPGQGSVQGDRSAESEIRGHVEGGI